MSHAEASKSPHSAISRHNLEQICGTLTPALLAKENIGRL